MTGTTSLAALLTTLLATAASAQQRDASREQQHTKGPEQVKDDLSPNVGDVLSGRALARRNVRDKIGKAVGRIDDVIVDPYFARVVALCIHLAEDVERRRRVVVPYEVA